MTETTFVTDMELAARGFDYGSQRQARNSGKLKFTPTESGFLYSSADISAWLESSAGSFRGKAFVQSPPATQAATRTPATAPARQNAPAAGSARSEWTAAVQSFVAKGSNKPHAISLADKKFPGLRERMLREVNAR